METWIIVTPLIVVAIVTIAGFYAIKLKLKKIRGKLYVYPKNGHQYMPLFRCRLKCPASGEWFDALIYQDYESGYLYVRERKDFLDKFVKLKDCNNGNNSKQGVSEAD